MMVCGDWEEKVVVEMRVQHLEMEELVNGIMVVIDCCSCSLKLETD